MTNQSNFRLNPDFQARLREAIVAAEGPSRTSIPASGDSGVSTGSMQLDLSKQHDFRAALIAAGQEAGRIGRTEAARQEADRLLRSTNRSVSAAERTAVETRARELVDGVLATPAGRQALEAAERNQLDVVERTVQRVCGQAGANARAFCNSAQGQLELAAHVHQYGPKTEKLEAFLRGEQITLDGGKDGRNNRTRMEGPLSVEQFRERFRNQTEWARESKGGNDGRHRKLDDFFRRQGIDDGSRARINPGQRSEATPSGQAAPTQTAQADDKIKNRVLGIEPAPGGGSRPIWGTDEEYEAARAKDVEAQGSSQASASIASERTREQTTNPGSSLAQPVAYRTTWNPDLGKLNEALASLGVDDLPTWTRNLLGRDVMANGAKAAVKGFQRAINDATRPPGLDPRWLFDKRNGRIDVDGDLGPQTRAGFGRAIDKAGENGFKKLYAIDQFGRYVKNIDRGRAKIDDFEDTVAGTLGQAIPDAPERAQETLNMLAEDREDPGSPLKIDGWVGPKTTQAFGTLMRKVSPETMTERFAGKDFWEDENLI